MIELAKDMLKYALIAAAMLFVVFRVINRALHPLFVVPEFKAEDTAKEQVDEEAKEDLAQKSSFDTNLQTARQLPTRTKNCRQRSQGVGEPWLTG